MKTTYGSYKTLLESFLQNSCYMSFKPAVKHKFAGLMDSNRYIKSLSEVMLLLLISKHCFTHIMTVCIDLILSPLVLHDLSLYWKWPTAGLTSDPPRCTVTCDTNNSGHKQTCGKTIFSHSAVFSSPVTTVSSPNRARAAPWACTGAYVHVQKQKQRKHKRVSHRFRKKLRQSDATDPPSCHKWSAHRCWREDERGVEGGGERGVGEGGGGGGLLAQSDN